MKLGYIVGIFCLFLVFSFAGNVVGQEKEKKVSKKDSLQILIFEKKIDTLKKQKNYQEVIKIQEELSLFLKNKKYLTKYFESELEIVKSWRMYFESDNTEKNLLYKLILEIKKMNYKNNIVYAKTINAMGRYYDNKNNKDSAFFYFHKAKNLFEKYYPTDENLSMTYANLTLFYIKSENLDSINFYQNKNFNLLKKIYHKKSENNVAFGKYLTMKGLVELHILRNYQKAILYNQQCYDLFYNLKGTNNSPEILNDYFLSAIRLGQTFGNTQNLQEAKKYFKKALKVLESNSDIIPNRLQISFYGNFASFYAKQAKIERDILKQKLYVDSSIYLYQKELGLNENNPNYNLLLGGITYPNIMLNYAMLKNNTKAIDYFKKAEEKLKIYHKNNLKNFDFGYLYGSVGGIYHNDKKYQEAVKMYQKSISCLVFGFDDTLNIFQNPNIKEAIIIDKQYLLEMLLKKAVCFAVIAKKDKKYWEYALNVALTYQDLIQMIMYEKQGKDAISFYQEIRNNYLFTLGFSIELENKNLYFEYLEKYRANILRAEASIHPNTANIDQNILDEEKKIRINLSQIEGELATNPNDEKLKDARFRQNLKQDSLVNFFSKQEKYKQYFNEKYNQKVISLAETQAKLKNDECILQYVLADKMLYITIINKKGLEIKKVSITKDSLEKKISDYRIYYAKSETINLFNASMDLYKILVEPVMPIIKNTPRWIVIPDALLFSINIEALFEKLPASTPYANGAIKVSIFPWAEVDYLMKKYIISYHLSATLVFGENITTNKSRNAKHDIMLIAPVYTKGKKVLSKNRIILNEAEKGTRGAMNNDGTELNALSYSEKEVNDIKKLFEVKQKNVNLLLEEQATEENVKKMSKDSKIIYFSTHSFFIFKNDNLSAISLYQPDSLEYANKKVKEDGMLFINEILALDSLKAEMVVLSSCDSGLGNIISGEGPMSLSYAFMRVGVFNLVYSLQKVPDEYTAMLLPLFYKHYLAGKKQAEAFNLAKKDFFKLCLEQGKKPTLNTWASFVLMERH